MLRYSCSMLFLPVSSTFFWIRMELHMAMISKRYFGIGSAIPTFS
jgi:hypothetical protein